MKPVFDVAFSGTSLTFNSSSLADVNGYWQPSARRELQKASTAPVVFYDFGISGATAQIIYDNRQTAINLHPTVAVIECGMNDAATSVTIADFKFIITALINAWKTGSPGTAIYLMTMNPAIAPAGAWKANLPTYYQAIRDVAVLESVGLIDNHPLWGVPTSTQIPIDGVHPTAIAARSILVPKLLSVLSPLVA